MIIDANNTLYVLIFILFSKNWDYKVVLIVNRNCDSGIQTSTVKVWMEFLVPTIEIYKCYVSFATKLLIDVDFDVDFA